MSKPMAKCPICGKLFEVCRSCRENKVESWKTVTDTEKCFEVFIILHRACVAKKMSKEEAKEKLLAMKLDFSTYPRHIQESICEITGLKLPEAEVETNNEVIEETKTEEVAKTTLKKAYSALKK